MNENEAVLPLRHSATTSNTLGERLRDMRESKGLSQQDVSKALCLPVHVIDALEQDAHEKLPAPVFIKGYLRNYAQFLSVPFCMEEIKAKMNTPLKPFNSPSALPLSSSLPWIRMVGYLLLKLLNYTVLIVFLCLLFLWWHDRHRAAEKELSLANLSVEKIPFPRPHSEPLPPDLKLGINIEKGENP